MEFLTSLFGSVETVAMWILPFLFVLTVIVFFHELGHFLVARWCGVKVDAFAIGFGREIFGFYDSQGTRWKFCWIPLGGYVKFMDDANATSAVADQDTLETMSDEEKAGSFHFKPLWQRAAVVAAGPIANFLLAIALFAGLFISYGKPLLPTIITEVVAGGAADQAGIKTGDRIVSIEGKKLESFADIRDFVQPSPNKPLDFVIARDGAQIPLVVTPQYKEIDTGLGEKAKVGLIGVRGGAQPGTDVEVKEYGVLDGFVEGVDRTWYITVTTLVALKDMVVGQGDPSQLGGPIKIAKVAKQAAGINFATLINLAAVISIGIGLLNLFPIPMLDGGHLVFYAAEAVRGKPLSEQTQEMAFRVGLFLVLMLMVFVTWNDIASLTRG